jgi:hypothetical protein
MESSPAFRMPVVSEQVMLSQAIRGSARYLPFTNSDSADVSAVDAPGKSDYFSLTSQKGGDPCQVVTNDRVR